MPVDAATVELVQTAMATLPDCGEFSELTSIAEVLAFVVETARAEGRDESDDVECVARAAPMSRAELRAAQSTLRRLGYRDVAERLSELARKSRPNRSSKPVPRRHKR